MSIDLARIKEAAEKAHAEACDLRSGSTRYMDELSEFTCDPELIVKLVAVVEAALTIDAAFKRAGTQGVTMDLGPVLEALYPFSHINGEQP